MRETDKEISDATFEQHHEHTEPTQGQGFEWEYGKLMFDDILAICDVKDVDWWNEGLTVSFVPKDATGKAWKGLKEKVRRTIDKS